MNVVRIAKDERSTYSSTSGKEVGEWEAGERERERKRERERLTEPLSTHKHWHVRNVVNTIKAEPELSSRRGVKLLLRVASVLNGSKIFFFEDSIVISEASACKCEKECDQAYLLLIGNTFLIELLTGFVVLSLTVAMPVP